MSQLQLAFSGSASDVIDSNDSSILKKKIPEIND